MTVLSRELRPITEHAGAHARLGVLDGLRAVAVIWVVAYHYLYFWTPAGAGTDLTAYGDAYAAVPFASVGLLGVHLFFMISGFVILLTLERTAALVPFLISRMIRLWPPLVLMGTLAFVVGHAFGPAEFKATWQEYLLSIVLLPPQHIGQIIGEPGWNWLDGAYWSLWIEVKFYLLIGVLFYFGRSRFLGLWTLYELVMMVIGVCALMVDSTAIEMLSGFLFQKYLPYFSFGLAGYLAFTGRGGSGVRRLVLLALVHVIFTTASDIGGELGESRWRVAQYVAGQLLIFGLFYAFAWRRAAPGALASPLMAGPGRASYGIYLMHQNIGLIALSQDWAATDRLGALAPLMVFVAVLAAAMLSYHHFELPLQRALRSLLLAPRSVIVTAVPVPGTGNPGPP